MIKLTCKNFFNPNQIIEFSITPSEFKKSKTNEGVIKALKIGDIYTGIIIKNGKEELQKGEIIKIEKDKL